MLFGSASLTNNIHAFDSKTQGMIWGVEYVTPGLIALAAVLVCFSINVLFY